jgi:hypothetical protein
MICDFCGEERVLDLLDVWAGERAWQFDTCCEEYHETLVADLQYAAELPARERVKFLAPLRALFAEYGIDIRQAFDSWQDGAFRLDYGLELREIEQRDAFAFIAAHHAHNKPPRGWRWGHALYNGEQLVAVAIVGRPVARMIDGATTVEVTRLCSDRTVDAALVWNASSMLYAAAAKEAKRRGYRKAITYTLETESGASLQASGWTPEAKTRGGSWNTPSRPRQDQAPTCPKVRWARALA